MKNMRTPSRSGAVPRPSHPASDAHDAQFVLLEKAGLITLSPVQDIGPDTVI